MFCLFATTMIRVKLREAMENYRLETGKRLTYAELANMSGIGAGTLSSIGSRLDYQANLATVEKLCLTLDISLGDLLEIIPDPPKPKRAKTKRAKKRG